MKGEDYKLIKENWDKFLKEEEVREVSRKSVPGLKKSMGALLQTGPQKTGGSLQNVEDLLPDKEDEEDISAPPGTPGGLEEALTQLLPGGISTIVNMGTQTPEVVRRWLANAKAEGAIPSWLKPYADKEPKKFLYNA